MVVYAAGSAYQVSLFKPIFNNVLTKDAVQQMHLGVFATSILLAYFLKGIGAKGVYDVEA